MAPAERFVVRLEISAGGPDARVELASEVEVRFLARVRPHPCRAGTSEISQRMAPPTAKRCARASMAAGLACSSYLPQKHQWEVKIMSDLLSTPFLGAAFGFFACDAGVAAARIQAREPGQVVGFDELAPQHGRDNWERVNAMARAATHGTTRGIHCL